MKKIFTAAFGIVMIAGTCMNAFAQTRSPRINARERRQQERISKGIANGRLTPREASRLENREASIDAREAADKSDGHFTRRERRNIEHRLNRTSRHIYRQKHDAQHGY